MNDKKVDFIVGSGRVHAEVRAIQGELQRGPASDGTCRRLVQRLEETTQTIESLRHKASSAFANSQMQALEELDDTVRELHGIVIEQQVNARVTLIVEEADAAFLGGIDPSTVKKLKRQISSLHDTYRMSAEHRRLVASVEERLGAAESQLQKTPISHFSFLAREKNVRFLESEELMPGEIEELFEIGRCLYEGKISAAREQFRQLSFSRQERFYEHMRALTAVPFEDKTETIQALLKMANELADNGEPYPSAGKIDEIFLGLRQVLEDDVRDSL